jgi:chorismate dehydratase
VSYLNTKPLLHGIKKHPIIDEIELVEDYPAKLAQALIEGKIDVGLIPVAATTRLSTWQIAGDYCIGCDGEVASVALFSEVPIEEVQTVLLDYQSRTSVNLAKILLREFWNKDVQLINATGEDFRAHIAGTTAGVVIGDRALAQRAHSAYIYDLGEAWKQHTGLPFVFAAWISTKALPADFLAAFNEANRQGLEQREHLAATLQHPHYNLKTYFEKNIDYRLDEKKRQALQLFLQKMEVGAAV